MNKTCGTGVRTDVETGERSRESGQKPPGRRHLGSDKGAKTAQRGTGSSFIKCSRDDGGICPCGRVRLGCLLTPRTKTGWKQTAEVPMKAKTVKLSEENRCESVTVAWAQPS